MNSKSHSLQSPAQNSHVPDSRTAQSVLQSLLTVMGKAFSHEQARNENKIAGLRNITAVGKIAKGKLSCVIHFWGQEKLYWSQLVSALRGAGVVH